MACTIVGQFVGLFYCLYKRVWLLNSAVVVDRVIGTSVPFYRPELPQEESAGVHPGVLTLIKQCWAEEPAERPSFDDIARALKTINNGKSVNI